MTSAGVPAARKMLPSPIPDRWRMTGDWIVPLAVWNEQRSQAPQRNGRNGVLLENTDDPRAGALLETAKVCVTYAINRPADVTPTPCFWNSSSGLPK